MACNDSHRAVATEQLPILALRLQETVRQHDENITRLHV